ncbi:hypothetical protein DH2020_000802 [Rehmannia glutinosa]|uniref:Retrotransposon gag domain-containing protein n=1 Tax=Rehmannia glutinosa TaxID=99300 RepID=A0ABR0XXN1_REHGL
MEYLPQSSLSWKQFSHELLCRYGDNPTANPFESLAATTQTGTVDEYVDMFISRAAHVHGLSDSHSLSLFLNGLRNDIHIRIRSKDAVDLFDTIHLTREIERKLQAPRGSRFGPTQPHTTSSGFTPVLWVFMRRTNTTKPTTPTHQWPNPNPGVGSQRNPPTPDSRFPATSVASSGSSQPNRGVRQLSHDDYLDLKAKGLCFKCREPYHPLHNCPAKSLRVMIAAERDGEEPPRELEYTDQLDSSEELAPTELQWLELSPLAAGGFDGPRTLKVMALLQGEPVRVMIDSGASHCFISTTTAHRLQLPIEHSGSMHVRLSDRPRREILGVCRNITLRFMACNIGRCPGKLGTNVDRFCCRWSHGFTAR